MLEANKERIEKRLKAIADCTEIAGEITRRTYTQAWNNAIDYVTKQMEQLDMSVRMDSFGNLIGKYNPNNSALKPNAIGSHIDSVKNAGAYDGVAGIVAGLEIVSMLHENKIAPKRPIEVLATADEEGAICQKGYFGARFMTGDMEVNQYLTFRNADGKNIAQLRKESGKFQDIPFGSDNGWAKDYYNSFVEVHVEQGNVLESENKQVGIVKGVVGIGRLFVEISGESDHAGPTLMCGRHDALAASAQLIQKVWQYGQAHSGKLTATVARLDNTPNIHNVISGHVSLIIDYRSPDDELSEKTVGCFKKYIKELEIDYGVEAAVAKETYTPVKLFSPKLIKAFTDLDFQDSMQLYSWAGHDAKAYANVTNTAMLFMPSIGGKSHCPQEYTKTESFVIVCNKLVNLYKDDVI